MYNIISSYWLRSRRTPVRLITFLCPILFSLIYGIYAINSKGLIGKEMEVFFCIYIILANFSISFYIPMIYEVDKVAGNFANDLRTGISRKKIFFSISILLFIIEFISILVMILIGFGKVEFNYISTVLCSLIGTIMLIPMIPVYQFLSLKLGFSGSILIGVFLTLSGILLGTTELGGNIWYLLPFVWPIKLIFAYTSHEVTSHVILVFLTLSVIITVVFIGVFNNWYNRWDGINKME
ncbi:MULTISPECIES: ABC-2 family transporter permease [Peptoniphilaceae]|uniref:hypothetical protein n=1 Tax=Peptoniphilaceae TaxID=1570339 RepID=UPI0002D43CD8|nr:hypothetical protein [Peptoniphilus senegalensis]